MTDTPRIRFVYPGGERFASAFQAANRQPNWVVKTAVIVFLLVVGIPVLLLLLTAAILATLVFAVLTAINRLLLGIRGGSGRAAGGPDDARRRNVKVLNRSNDQP